MHAGFGHATTPIDAAVDTNLRGLDVRHLWHPYTDIAAFEQSGSTIIERAEGVFLYEEGGRPILDGIASWWACNLGHSHPKVVAAIREQAGVLQHSILGRLSHPLAIRLAHRLAEIAPGDLNHVYFAADGASATEAALKIAIQYWANQGVEGKSRFICLADGYHGDTLGAVGVGFVPTFHECFKDAIVPAYRAESPHCRKCPYGLSPDSCAIECFQPMEDLIRQHHNEVAAVIVEPLVQGAAGVRIYPDEYLQKLRALCDEYNLLLIADEVATGFGRTGSLFACDHAGIVPDVLCLGKALTAGYLPMSATIVTGEVYDAFRNDGGRDRTFYDGHTFCGNPITAAAALAAIEEYVDNGIIEQSEPLAQRLHDGMKSLGRYDCIDWIQCLGLIGMCGFSGASGGSAKAKEVANRALELGLFIRPLGDVLYLWPPMVTTNAELDDMLRIFRQAIEDTET